MNIKPISKKFLKGFIINVVEGSIERTIYIDAISQEEAEELAITEFCSLVGANPDYNNAEATTI